MNRAERISYPVVEALGLMLAAAYARVRDAALARIEARRRARSARHLRKLSDHVLRDIGLHRSQLDAADFGGWPGR